MPTWIFKLVISKIFEKGMIEKFLPMLIDAILKFLAKKK